MNYGEIKLNDIADGPGVRVSLFVSGCTHHCRGCHNPETWNFGFGKLYTEETESYILDALDRDEIEGLTFLGGEPFEPQNSIVLNELAKKSRLRFPEKTIWCYSGYLFDEIHHDTMKGGSVSKELLYNLDVLVDGEFIEAKKSLMLQFRGSSNQRLIDIPKTLENNYITIWAGQY